MRGEVSAALATAFVLLLGTGTAHSAPTPDLVPVRSGVRSQAIAALASGPPATGCLTPLSQSIRSDRQHGTTAARRAFAALASDPALPGERLAVDLDGLSTRFTVDRNAPDRVDLVDDNANGRPDVVDDALAGAAAARRLLVGQLELPNPGGIEIVLARLGSGTEGVSVPVAGRPSRTRIWLDPSVRGGAIGIRSAAEHQYAHAVAAAAGLDPAWGEAFATWTSLALEGAFDDRTLGLIAGRLGSMREGLVAQDPEIAGGNAAWFSFLHDAYGATAVKLAVEELGRGGSDQAALDRAIRRATGEAIDTALRDFQIWSLLVGSRDDGRHFTFASRLPNPAFAASQDALPALSIQADPAVGPMGQTAVLLRPDELSGGLTVRFEGDLASRWGVDLLVVRPGGELRRVPLTLDADDSGELTLPLQDVREVILLVRNLDPEGRPARRYSWEAHFERGYPAEFAALRVESMPAAGVLVSWDTASERHLLGFNVLRTPVDGFEPTRVNPVWIPSVAESGGPASYSFYDATASPGVAYRYRIEAVTLEGLQSRSEAVALSPAP